MEALFTFFIVFDVFSIRLPIGIRQLNASYFFTLLLIVWAALHSVRPSLPVWTRANARQLNVFLVLFFLAIAVPILFREKQHIESIYYTIMLAVWIAGHVAMTHTIRISILKFMRYYLGSVIFLVAISVPSYFLMGEQRLDSFFGGATNRIGIYSAIALLCIPYILAYRLDERFKVIYRVGAIVCLAGFVLTFSRTAFLAFFIAFAEHTFRKKILKLRYILLLALAIAAVILFLNYQYTSTGELRYLRLMIKLGVNDLFGYEHIEGFRVVSRLDHYKNAYDVITQNWSTILFGLGLESYRSTEFLANTRGHATALHSIYLQYLMGGGVVALTLLFLYLGTLCRYIYRLQEWQKDLCLFMFIPAVIHAAFQPAIFSRELFIFLPVLVLSCMYGNRKSMGLVSDRQKTGLATESENSRLAPS